MELYYLNSRYYDPEVGRFINADSMLKTPNSGVLSANMFAYCENNPIMSSDSTGQWFGLDDLIAGDVDAVVGIASGFVGDLGVSCGMGVKNYISNSMQSNREQKATSIGPIYWCAP